MRCLSLAEASKQRTGEPCLFFSSELSPSLASRIQEAGHRRQHINADPGTREDADAVLDALQDEEVSGIVVDGYRFEAPYLETLKKGGLLAYFDDWAHLDRYPADFIVNQNLHAARQAYEPLEGTTRLLLGPTYAVLREEFAAYAGWERTHPVTAKRVLITLGGSDEDDATTRILKTLPPLLEEGIEARVIVGGSNPHQETIYAKAKELGPTVTVEQDVESMAERMAWADVAVCAGGTTVWEMAYMQVPMLVTVLAKNQAPIAAGLEEAGLALNLGWAHDVDVEAIRKALGSLIHDQQRREAMGQEGKATVDHKGTQRILDALEADL